MATVRFSADDEARLAGVLEALDPAGSGVLADCRGLLVPPEWALLVTYARARIERSLRLGMALRAVADALDLDATAYPGRGTPTFVRDAAAAMADSFAPVPACWELAPILEKLEHTREACVMTDIRSLELLAESRLTRDLDDDLRALLG